MRILALTALLLAGASAFSGSSVLPASRLGALHLSQKLSRTRLRGGGSDTKMGVEVTTERPGDGTTYPKKGDMLTMHYHGTLADGSKFDSSYDRGSPFKFQIGVGQVIKGWDEGVIKMSLGEKARLNITPDYGYGERGFPPVIPPSSELIFDVELLGINQQMA
uniref:peptidylprolyl isomerase n=1 Tax=Hemiselmis andersenii TaxID=464988 RepID=A0A6U2CVY4_HEMAN|mmetsp:Transcript_22476/g.52164  ORF Transcript_22476/g.52164 Transcript_22476/m.52164 type:complete len:163 (-) Transcript_22476:182-670(-)|eukprot:CAMPEP_0172015744 /NCGR_PEP_ID=MMETSP1041-20130122/10641_1 /TAXON_ID=464988 /ORGANISM="Hemiselmis andersenii, Strain CCMP439" /LENGTH=162 /DNA_ID=CAMNT_0012670621 /DNA_START=16 /DNA_END=504 /DNA_ORIENTATION=-